MHDLSLYQTFGEETDADRLAVHLPMVKHIASHLRARLPANVDIDDLMQVGMIGLLEAMQNFNAEKGAKFETYAKLRVRGAMLDEVRRFSTLPRSVMSSMRTINTHTSELEQKLGRAPADSELADYMGITLDDLYDQKGRNYNSTVISLEDHPEDYEPPFLGLSPSNKVDEDDFRSALAKAIGHLSEREQLIFSLYYDEELNLKEIAQILDVSESRICQIQKKSVQNLRQELIEWL